MKRKRHWIFFFFLAEYGCRIFWIFLYWRRKKKKKEIDINLKGTWKYWERAQGWWIHSVYAVRKKKRKTGGKKRRAESRTQSAPFLVDVHPSGIQCHQTSLVAFAPRGRAPRRRRRRRSWRLVSWCDHHPISSCVFSSLFSSRITK